jgi:steroid delta-isomerase-like uncharacterized protein
LRRKGRKDALVWEARKEESFMSLDENKEKIRRVFEEAFGQGKVEVIDELLHSDFVCYDPNSEAGEVRGADTIRGEVGYFHNAFPDFFWRVEDQVAEGDKVTSRYTFGGTHQGEFFGVAGTGKRIEITGINIDRFDEDGKLVEEWAEYDLLGAMRQIGAIPQTEH